MNQKSTIQSAPRPTARIGLWARRSVLAVASAVSIAVGHADARIEIRLNAVQSFIPEFPVKRKMNAAYRPELNRLLEQIHRRMEAGENVLCSAQIFEEVHWLINYTPRREHIERKIKDLRRSLANPELASVSGQDPTDGSFAPCMESWIWRFFRSVDPLKALAQKGEKPKIPLKIWEPVDTPEKLKALMRGLLVSDISTGYNKRKELNLAITALGQLLWLDYTANVFPEHLNRDALAEALREFVDEEWQDGETGYWGAWFNDGEQIRRTQDLSITFHIISYRGGDVARKRQIGTTTGALRRVKYPYGWNTGGTQNNHHAYDVARIINLTWEELDETDRSQAGAHMYLMQARSLTSSIRADWSFDPTPYTTVGEAYYFGISFFEEMGLFGNPVARDRFTEITNTEDLYRKLRNHLDKLDDADPWVVAAKHKLDRLGPSGR